MRRLRQALGPLRANMYSKAFEVVVHTSPFSFLLQPIISHLFSRKPGMTPITILGGSHQPITSASVRNYRIGLAAESRHTKHRHVTCDLEVRHNRAQLQCCQSNRRLEGQTVLFASPNDLCSYWAHLLLETQWQRGKRTASQDWVAINVKRDGSRYEESFRSCKLSNEPPGWHLICAGSSLSTELNMERLFETT
jgi:hypothetical protein